MREHADFWYTQQNRTLTHGGSERGSTASIIQPLEKFVRIKFIQSGIGNVAAKSPEERYQSWRQVTARSIGA